MQRSHIEIRTGDGVSSASVFRPAGTGPWPGVLMFHDGLGIRPAMHALAASIAAGGYEVLIPDLFHRMAPYESPDPVALFSDPEVRAAWWAKAQTNTAAAILGDVKHYLARVPGRRVSATGYCMGGRLALCAAAMYPKGLSTVAAYHPGQLVTDAADSPHLSFDKIKARVYIGAATDDATFTPEHQAEVTAALRRGSVDHVLEVYPAKHGWVPTDMPVHDAHCAARHRETLFALLGPAR